MRGLQPASSCRFSSRTQPRPLSSMRPSPSGRIANSLAALPSRLSVGLTPTNSRCMLEAHCTTSQCTPPNQQEGGDGNAFLPFKEVQYAAYHEGSSPRSEERRVGKEG